MTKCKRTKGLTYRNDYYTSTQYNTLIHNSYDIFWVKRTLINKMDIN